MKVTFNHNSQAFLVDIVPLGKSYRSTTRDQTVEVEILRVHAEDGQLELIIDGQRVVAYVSSNGAKRWVTINGQTFVLTKSSGTKPRGVGHDHAAEIAAPMPGQVRGVNVSEGDAVKKGQTLLVLEAMKMEIRIQAPRDGVVKKLVVKQGQTVEREQILIEIEER